MESSSQKTRSPIFPCPCSHASSSHVQLYLDNWFLGNSNSLLIQTKSDSLGFTSYIYCKFNFKNPLTLDHSNVLLPPFSAFHQWFWPVTASVFMLCPKFNPQMLCVHLFLDRCAVPYYHETTRTCKATQNFFIFNKLATSHKLHWEQWNYCMFLLFIINLLALLELYNLLLNYNFNF